MRHRIRTIIWLLAACVLGINGFQAYWLYSTYRFTTAQFDRVAHEALVATVQQQLIVGIDELKQEGFDVVLRGTSSAQVGPRRVVYASDVTVIPLTTSCSEAVNVARHLDHITIDDWRSGLRLDPARLTQLYGQQLRQYGLDPAAQLDTFSVRRGSVAGQHLRLPGHASGRFTQPTPAVLLSPKHGLYVRAYLPSPMPYVWRHMAGLLGGSALLLVLTTCCFVLVLHTMLAQRKLVEAKNDFINNMTHELKTPLTTAAAAVETLEHFGPQAEPGKTQTYLRIARTELRRLAELVEKVLSLASKESATLDLRLELVDPAELVRAVVRRYELQAGQRVQFRLELEPTTPVPADRLHLDGVLHNLIDNAIKYSREQVTIRLHGRQTAQRWELTVQDDGIGIPRSYQEAIFDRFFRVPTGNLHPVKGFGLGLYYVRQVVERHGGRIAVRSTPGRGSAFSLWLPLG